MNFAARTCRWQHKLCCSKECPSSKLKWLKILTQCYLFVNEICTMVGSHFPRWLGLLVFISTTSHVFKAHMHVSTKKWLSQNPATSLTTCYGHAMYTSSRHLPSHKNFITSAAFTPHDNHMCSMGYWKTQNNRTPEQQNKNSKNVHLHSMQVTPSLPRPVLYPEVTRCCEL